VQGSHQLATFAYERRFIGFGLINLSSLRISYLYIYLRTYTCSWLVGRRWCTWTRWRRDAAPGSLPSSSSSSPPSASKTGRSSFFDYAL